MKIFFSAFLAVILFSKTTFAQTIYNYSIEDVLNSMPTGTRLPDGTIMKVKIVTTGTGEESNKMGTTDPTSLGGTYNGTALAAYEGSTNANLFSNISASTRGKVDRGNATNCANSVGFHIWFNRPTNYGNLLFLDIDGSINGQFSNQEWSAVFAFNGNTYVPTSTSFHTTTDLEKQNVTLGVNHVWRSLVTSRINATAAANLPSPFSVVKQNNPNQEEVDPDERPNQFLADPDALVTDFFVLWGIWHDLSAEPTGVQNSGISPISVSLSPDFGDAPNTYKTRLGNDGPSHGVVSTLKLGATINTEANGDPSVEANSHTDDDGITASLVTIPRTETDYSVTVKVNNTTSLEAQLVAWIDWNNNGSFEASEGIKRTTNTSGESDVTFTWNNYKVSNIPTDLHTYLRVRVTTDAISTADVGGSFINGEVEDYRLSIETSLPVSLLSFTAKAIDKAVLLNWKTVSEKNFSHFEVEKSADARHFQRISALDGASSNYSHTDNSPFEGPNYYRLKMVDTDGSTDSSKIIAVNYDSNQTFLHTENPAKGLDLKVFTNAQNPNFEMYSISGVPVPLATGAIDSASNKYLLKIKEPTPGVYILKMNYGGKIITRKVIIP